ncbi:hypothetical protein MRX96_044730 [Rhipicephalus microplus]
MRRRDLGNGTGSVTPRSGRRCCVGGWDVLGARGASGVDGWRRQEWGARASVGWSERRQLSCIGQGECTTFCFAAAISIRASRWSGLLSLARRSRRHRML